ncbi:MAG TPA: GH25 family lysozyme [Kofleriaceae bacterium]|jgi:GH25 family lysozyme M1 (1,4-beta-N-acetylmuramidase)
MAAGCLGGGERTGEETQAATVCAGSNTLAGIDVSYYEDSIDWSAVKAAGTSFAFVRVSDGLQFPDPTFADYYAGAQTAGLIRGAYQYFRPAEDPIAQADLLLQGIGTLGPGDLPPVLDLEVSGGLDTAGVDAAVQMWVEHVTAAIGRPPIIYAGLYSWPELTGGLDMTTSPLWVAQYGPTCPDIPDPWTSWMFWQTGSGHVDGIAGSDLDIDTFDGTLADLTAFATPAVCGDGVCSPGETSDTCVADCPPCGTIAATGGMIDDGDACFVGGGPAAYLRDVTDAGEGGDLVWTHATDSATEANFATWTLYLAEAGMYRVEAYTDHAYAQSQHAKYHVIAGGADNMVELDQSAADGWQSLGEFSFASGGMQQVHLGDNTGEAPSDNIQLVFDAVRLTRVDDVTGSGSGSGSGSDMTPTKDGDDSGCAAGGSGGIGAAIALAGLRRRRRS